MGELPPELDPKFSKVKSKKGLKIGMVLRIPWPTGALDRSLGYKLCPIHHISKNGNPIVTTENGGMLELETVKDLHFVKGTDQDEFAAGKALFDSDGR